MNDYKKVDVVMTRLNILENQAKDAASSLLPENPTEGDFNYG